MLSKRQIMNSTPIWEMIGMFSSGGLYVISSAGMMAFNKYIINRNRFPYALFLVFVHSGFGAMMSLALCICKPSLFPSLTSTTTKVKIDKSTVIGGVVPIAVLFAGQLVLCQQAFLHSSVTFMQMLKEFNVVMVYGISLLCGVESFSSMRMNVLIMITFATLLTIRGELHFSRIGFIVQGVGQVLECVKIVMQGMLLTKNTGKIDPLSYILIFMPFCFSILGVLLLVSFYVDIGLRIPLWSEAVAWAPVLLANASLAFILNVSSAIFLMYGSAISFVLAGVLKDVLIVIGGATIMGEHVSGMQTFAFTAQVGLVWMWSMMNMFPNKFRNEAVTGMRSLCFWNPDTEKDEESRLHRNP